MPQSWIVNEKTDQIRLCPADQLTFTNAGGGSFGHSQRAPGLTWDGKWYFRSSTTASPSAFFTDDLAQLTGQPANRGAIPVRPVSRVFYESGLNASDLQYCREYYDGAGGFFDEYLITAATFGSRKHSLRLPNIVQGTCILTGGYSAPPSTLDPYYGIVNAQFVGSTRFGSTTFRRGIHKINASELLVPGANADAFYAATSEFATTNQTGLASPAPFTGTAPIVPWGLAYQGRSGGTGPHEIFAMIEPSNNVNQPFLSVMHRTIPAGTFTFVRAATLPSGTYYGIAITRNWQVADINVGTAFSILLLADIPSLGGYGLYWNRYIDFPFGSDNTTTLQVLLPDTIGFPRGLGHWGYNNQGSSGSGTPGDIYYSIPEMTGSTAPAKNYEFSLGTSATVTLITPSSGTVVGGNSVVIDGSGFNGSPNFGLRVYINNIQATITTNTSTQITCTAPASGSTGAKQVRVHTLSNGIITLPNAYTYTAPTTAAWVTDFGGIPKFVGPNTPPIELEFKLFDLESDLVNVEIKFRPFSDPSPSNFPSFLNVQSGDSLTGLASSLAGTTHKIRWIPQNQAGLANPNPSCQIRLQITSPNDSTGPLYVLDVPLTDQQNLGPRPRNVFLEKIDPEITITDADAGGGRFRGHIKLRTELPYLVIHGTGFSKLDALGAPKIKTFILRSNLDLHSYVEPELSIVNDNLINVTGIVLPLTRGYEIILLDKDRNIICRAPDLIGVVNDPISGF